MFQFYFLIFCLLQGVKFLWDCVTGRRIEDSHGCIMADEMVTSDLIPVNNEPTNDILSAKSVKSIAEK